MTKQIKSKGFTIVELLIVIVVIAILAAITIVAYNGIQQRAHTTAQQTTAENVAKKLEAYNAINNSYPTSTVTSALSGDNSTALGNSLKLSTAASGVPDNTVEVDLCSTSTTALGTSTNASGYIVKIYNQVKGTVEVAQAGGNVSMKTNTGSTANTYNETSTINCSQQAS